MNTNVLVGLLIAALLVVGGYFLMTDSPSDEAYTTPTPGDTVDNYSTPTPTTPPVSPTPSAPTVITSQNYNPSSSTAVVTGSVKPNGALTSYWFEYGESTALGTKTNDQQIGSGYNTITTPAFITGLKADTTYYYRLSARNSFATVNGSTYTLKTNETAPPTGTIPIARTLSANNIERTSANLRGEVNPKNSETRYWFEYGKDINFGLVTQIQTVASGSATLSIAASISSLDPLTRYYFRLNAQNQFGTVNGTILNFTTKGPAATSAPTVSTDEASNIGKNSARLNGTINPNGVATTYWFEYSQDSLLGSIIGTSTPVQNLSAGTSSVDVRANISNLNPETKYFYRLVAKNQHGTVSGSVMSFTTEK